MTCTCKVFAFWYRTDSGTAVCECGHPEREHLGRWRTKACTGEVEIR